MPYINRFYIINSVEKLLLKNKNKVAAIIVEPVAGNMGLVLPKKNFLKGLKESF